MTSESTATHASRVPSPADAIVPLVVLAILIGSAVALFGLDALDTWPGR